MCLRASDVSCLMRLAHREQPNYLRSAGLLDQTHQPRKPQVSGSVRSEPTETSRGPGRRHVSVSGDCRTLAFVVKTAAEKPPLRKINKNKTVISWGKLSSAHLVCLRVSGSISGFLPVQRQGFLCCWCLLRRQSWLPETPEAKAKLK